MNKKNLMRRASNRLKRIEAVHRGAGWSRKKSNDELKRIKKMGLSETFYIQNEGWKLTDAELLSKVSNDYLDNKKKLTKYADILEYKAISRNGEKKKVAIITGIKSNKKKIVIPEKIGGYNIVEISEKAFAGNKKIEEVILSDTVKYVGREAFANCTTLKRIELSPHIETIAVGCFEGCTSLEELVIPSKLLHIEERAFKNCKSLNNIYHYVKIGNGEKARIWKSMQEKNIPIEVLSIGAYAFEGCTSLEYFYLPYKINVIEKGMLKNCSSVKDVRLHNEVTEIKEEAFLGCLSLNNIRLSQSLKMLEKDSFSENTNLICSDITEELLKSEGFFNYTVSKPCKRVLVSNMIPRVGESVDKSFYSREELETSVNYYETRTPVSLVENTDDKRNILGDKSRFSLESGTYVYNDPNKLGYAKILMTGDLMCKSKPTRAALTRDGVYQFDECFEDVKEILQTGDLRIGNLESTISKSIPYCSKQPWVNGRLHLNAPEEYLKSVKSAGFDLVINAQNHSYDAGTRGIFETLDALNRAQLMHTGLFASKEEKRYISLEVNGIHIAVVSYFDQLRQAMKRINFTREGLKDIFSVFDENQIKKDIADAKAEGAEFVIAYCHCGKEYTDKITDIQAKYTNLVANAGADYIFGCHSHCLQPYGVILTEDNREVPVLYSGGNFMSDSTMNMPYTRDTLIAELNLYRDVDGRVRIKSEGYYPCLIKNIDGNENLQKNIPISKILENCDLETKIEMEEALLRINTTLGANERFKCLLDLDNQLETIMNGNVSEIEKKYGVQPIRIARKIQTEEIIEKNDYYLDAEDNVYKRCQDDGEREARIVCTGSIDYDAILERDANCFGSYEFLKSFKTVANCFENTDFVLGNLNTMASNNYPSMTEISSAYVEKEGYNNCRKEFVSALKKSGFSGVAMANPYNACLGLQGVFDTEKTIREKGLICSGIGYEKTPIVEINGIKIAIVSITTECINAKNTITDEGLSIFANVYQENRTQKLISYARECGAEFVLVYIHCGTNSKNSTSSRRERIAEKIAEMGADYIICNVPKVVSRYYRYQTKDNRNVPIATSLGSFISGDNDENGYGTAIIKLFIRRNFDGTIDIDDNYIPIKVFKEHKGVQNAIMPAQRFFNSSYTTTNYSKVVKDVVNRLDSQIRKNYERTVRINSSYTKNLTIAEIYKILGKKPSKKDLERLGDKYHKEVTCITQRRVNMKAGCVAIMYSYGDFYQKVPIKWDIKDCVKAGASLVIDNVPHPELPCIVVSEPLLEVYQKLSEVVRDWYNPVTVAITGSMGKTTTKELTARAFETHYKTLHIHGNSNTIYQIGQVVQKLSNDDEAYIQEVHGGTKGMASCISKLIKPDICVITNIEKNHMSQLGSVENLIKSKMEVIDGLKENGVLILCNDNSYLREMNPDVRTIRYSTSDESCHYYARNIVNTDDGTIFEIVSNESEFDGYGVYKAKLNIQGEHNVGNALAAFAAGRQAGIPAYKIIAGLSRYRTQGIRQNIIEHGGIKMIIDAYNSNPVALLAMLDVFEQIPPKDGGKKIAVLGMMGEQGKESKEIHYNIGKEICKYNIDILFCFGEDAKYMVKAAKECGCEAYYFEERSVFNKVIAETVKPGDVVLFKGSHSMALDTETIIPIFGNVGKK